MMEWLQSLTGNYFLVLSSLVFIAVVLLLESLFLLWQSYRGKEAKRIASRLEALSGSADLSRQARLLKQRMLSEVPAFDRFLFGLPVMHRLQKSIHQAGLGWTASMLLLWCAVAGCLGYLAMVIFARQSMLAGAVAGLLLAGLPMLYVSFRRGRRLTRLERQLPEAIDMLTRALRSGHAFPSGLQMIGQEMSEPIANEFRIVHDEVNFGVSMQQALMNLSERVPSTDLRYFVVAVLIQRDSGGNLTEILGNLSNLIRERLKLQGKIKVLSSEGRLSAWILGLMPFGLGAVMNAFNPEFMRPLWTDPLGITIMQCLLSMMAIGAVIMWKIIKIRV